MPDQTPTQSQGPMVLVKKADGSTARVLLSELKKQMRAGPLSQKSIAMEGRAESGPMLAYGLAEDMGVGRPASARFATAEERRPVAPKETAGVRKIIDPKSGRAQKKWEPDDHKSLLDDAFHNENLPMVIEARRQALAKVSPVKAIWVDTAASQVKSQKSKVQNRELSVISQRSVSSDQVAVGSKPRFVNQAGLIIGQRLRAKPSVKPHLHDVVRASAVPQISVGPVDELRQFTLTDWRRLAPSAQAAESKLEQKFKTLKDESFMLYLDGRAAWQESPLYNQYLNVLVQALRQRKPVAQILSSAAGDELSVEEFKAVVELNRAVAKLT